MDLPSGPDPRFKEALRVLELYDRDGRLLSPEELQQRHDQWRAHLWHRRKKIEALKESVRQMEADLAKEEMECLTGARAN